MMIDVFEEERARVSDVSKQRPDWYPTTQREVSTGTEATRGVE